MIEVPTTLHISFREFIQWLQRIFSREHKTENCKVKNPWVGEYAQTLYPTPKIQLSPQEQSQQLGAVATSVKSSAQTSVELAAQNAAFAKLAAFFLVIGNALAEAAKTIHEHAKASSALYYTNAQVYAKLGARMG